MASFLYGWFTGAMENGLGAVLCIIRCLEIQKKGVTFTARHKGLGGGSCYFCLGSKGCLGTLCKGKDAESHWACLGL